MKKKILKIVIIMLLLIMTYTTIVNALSLSVTMETDNTTVQEETEFLVTFNVSNIDVGENGINSLSGYLEYDEEIFETVNKSSIEGLNGWATDYNADDKKITLTKQNFVKSEEKVFSMTFKTKSEVNGKEGIIKFKNINAGNSEKTIDAKDVSLTIVVGKENGNTANVANTNATIAIGANTNKSNNSSTNASNTNATNNTSNNVVSYVNTANTVKNEIPETGVEDTILFLIIGAVIIAIAVFIRIEVINRDMKK